MDINSVINVDTMKSLLKRLADDMKYHVEELRDLDAQLGDGDLGVTISIFSQSVMEYCETSKETDFGLFLSKCSMQINKANPSTFGTLLAASFMGAAKVVKGKQEITITDLAAMGDGAIEEVQKRGKAKLGDKTMLDTLMPAVEAFKKALTENKDIEAIIEETLATGKAGMQSTAKMKANIGRARMFGDRSLGILDGGATAAYYIIAHFCRALLQN